jgi:tRNA (cytidine/uridine-2'-O-)-methyltransferase
VVSAQPTNPASAPSSTDAHTQFRMYEHEPPQRLMLALYQPDIPQNCGTMLRLCACMDIAAAIIEPAGFPVSDRDFRRAGMDYLEHVVLTRHASWRAFEAWRATMGRRLLLLSTKADLAYWDFAFAASDILLVGRESAGVPDEVHVAADERLVIPIAAPLRSLNVAVAAAMVVGEALRQLRVAESI